MQPSLVMAGSSSTALNSRLRVMSCWVSGVAYPRMLPNCPLSLDWELSSGVVQGSPSTSTPRWTFAMSCTMLDPFLGSGAIGVNNTWLTLRRSSDVNRGRCSHTYLKHVATLSMCLFYFSTIHYLRYNDTSLDRIFNPFF